MIIGTTIFKMDGNAYYTPDFGRVSLEATFTIEVTHLEGSPTITVTIQTRNEDATTWDDLTTFPNITATGVHTTDTDRLKELIRLKFAFAAGDQSTDGCHFFIGAPVWRPST